MPAHPIYRYDFEKPLAELAHRLDELRKDAGKKDHSATIRSIESEIEQHKRKAYSNLTAWQRVQLARHPLRPYTLDYIQMITEQYTELHGDRLFGDDKALIGGVAQLDGRPVVVLGHQKGRDTKENLMRNFGSAHPEGYRKSLRLMQLAAKRRMPVLVFIDTPGAYPGIGAEERGQAHSIAWNMREMARLRTPVFICVIGEGGSGGALGVGVGDWVAMLEHSYYSVISPEGCAAILWRDRAKAPDAAEALKLTANDLMKLGLIDDIVAEPLGGAHHDPAAVAKRIKDAIVRSWKTLDRLSIDELLERRYERFRKVGAFETLPQPAAPAPAA